MSAWDLVEKSIDDAVDFGEALATHLDDMDNREKAQAMMAAEKAADTSHDAALAEIGRLEREHAALRRVYDTWAEGWHHRTPEDLARRVCAAMNEARAVLEAKP